MDAKDNQVKEDQKRKELERSWAKKSYQLDGEGAGTETGRKRQPGRSSSEEERAGTELGTNINQLGGAGAETGCQRQPGRRSSKEKKAGTEPGNQLGGEGAETETGRHRQLGRRSSEEKELERRLRSQAQKSIS